MKEKWTTFLGGVLWIGFFILALKLGELENKFWFGFVCGAYATILIGGTIIAIKQSKNK